tara:strand:+ start:723 stop:1664 length:942 start_codon:yes stop_codon:yes gene_type:complete
MDDTIEAGWIEFIVPEGVHEARVDKVLADRLEGVSRTQLQKAFDAKEVLLEGKALAKRHLVSEGDVLTLKLPELPDTKVVPVKMDLDILHEDDDVIIVNKPAGMIVHPGHGKQETTLVHGLLAHCDLAPAGGEQRPGVVHRLDRDTTGAVVFAKTDKAYYKMIKLFSNREVDKEYLALVNKVPRLLAGSINRPIGRHPINRTLMTIAEDGRDARTDWKIEKAYGTSCALVRCILHTGRTHQIRVHLKDLGHVIVGDNSYGYRISKTCPLECERVMLHAEKLGFAHPVSGEPVRVVAPLPEAFKQMLEAAEKLG